MGEAARNQRVKTKERPDADLGRLGVLAILALLVFAAAPGLRLLTAGGPAAGWTAERGLPAPAETGTAEAEDEEILRRSPRRVAAFPGQVPDAPPAGLAASIDLLPAARTTIRNADPARPPAEDRRRRAYDPRGPPAA